MGRFEYRIAGMTCEHCERRVANEVGRITNVESVIADAATGLIIVTADNRPDTAAVAEAVTEAGYEFASA